VFTKLSFTPIGETDALSVAEAAKCGGAIQAPPSFQASVTYSYYCHSGKLFG
jgi:hypothetical protein